MLASPSIFLALLATTVVAFPNPSNLASTSPINERSDVAASNYSTGYLTCIETNTGTVRYISAKAKKNGVYTISANHSDPLLVQIDLNRASLGPVSMIAKTGSLNTSFPYVGAIWGIYHKPMPAEVPNLAYIGGTAQTESGKVATGRPNSFDSHGGGNATDVQDAFWRYEPESGYLIPELPSKNGNKVEAYFITPSPSLVLLIASDVPGAITKPLATKCNLKFNPQS